MSTKPETVYESPETTPDGKPFLTVKKARGYYYYTQRGGTDSVFFILHDKSKDKYALILEGKPPLDEQSLNSKLAMGVTAFGGSLDNSNLTAHDIVKLEVMEEAGYVVPLDRIINCGYTMVSTQMDQIAHGFIVDVTGIKKSQLTEFEKPDASDEFKRNRVKWMSESEIMDNQDWKSIFILSRYKHNQLNQLDTKEPQ